MAHFKIEDLSFCFPGAGERAALKNVSFTVEAGEFILICGKSGSGKTTLMRHMKTVLAPHGKREGCVLFEDRPLDQVSLREQSARIGFVMQNPDSQIVTDKVWHELAFGLESLGCDQSAMRLRVAEMASYFGIQSWFHRNVSELSGGQKQLLNLASAMAMQPDVLILDEPTSQLDPIAASDFLNTVRKINRELGMTVILTEHRLEDIFYAADRVIVMDGGRIIANDVPRKVGPRLFRDRNEMFAAMPAPVRICCESGVEIGECPLTVREGRSWLGRAMKHAPQPDAIAQGAPFEAPEAPVLCAQEIWYRYAKDAPDVLRGVNLRVPGGSLFAIVGGNGTGKSTLLKAICGICPPYRGKIKIMGKRVERYRASELFQGMLAMLPQDPQSLFVKKTVRDDLWEMITGADRDCEMARVSEICEIESLLDRHPYDLSGGEQQRAALAKVLLTRPQILLLDEPTKGIDSFFKQKLAGILKKLIRDGMTVVMVSHDVEFCARYADSVSMFFDGQILTTNTPRRFFAQNSFYTTAANRMSRHLIPNAVTAEDVIEVFKGVNDYEG